MKRILSAAILAPLALAAVWSGGAWLGALLMAAAGIMANEWLRLCFKHRPDEHPWSPSPKPEAMIFLVIVLVAALAATLGYFVPAIVISVIGAIAMLGLSRGPTPIDSILLSFGVIYSTLPILSLLAIRGDEQFGRDTVFLILFVVWATDSCAYAAGRLIGGPKLAPSISPQKTWSGLFGGLLGATVVGAGGWILGFAAQPLRIILLSIVLSLAAQAGDLLESAVKRHFDVKDSGSIIPGHGGVLDRIDGLLIALPVAALGLLLTGNGDFIWR